VALNGRLARASTSSNSTPDPLPSRCAIGSTSPKNHRRLLSGSRKTRLQSKAEGSSVLLMPDESSHQHIQRIRRERFWLDDASRVPSENPLMAMLRRALNQLATGIFEHAHHYVFELTQNADDNNYPDHADRFLKFVLLEDDPTDTPGSRGCLCVLNDETGFERKHVESLCDIGNSTKQGNRDD
jgi:hypothetical protein